MIDKTRKKQVIRNFFAESTKLRFIISLRRIKKKKFTRCAFLRFYYFWFRQYNTLYHLFLRKMQKN
jgi:hypothetical protein